MFNAQYILMEKGPLFCFLLFITFLSSLDISTSSQPACNSTVECKNASNSVCCNNICQLPSECRINAPYSNTSNSNNYSKNSKGNEAAPRHDNVDKNPCVKDQECNSSNAICISQECSIRNPDNVELECHRCESIGCRDGRCFNSTVGPTAVAQKEAITTLQLVLLFGSMGGIFIFIIIVYCVKTFTDNRTRQYLLKHGIWENKDAKNEEGESKSDSNRQHIKLEVPTITVETETEAKKKKKKKENSKDEITDTDGLEEFAVQQEESRNAKVKSVEDEGNPSTKTPNLQIGPNIESPPNSTIPTAWDNINEFTPLTDSPRQKRFGNFMKSKDSPPTKILPNGTPERSPIFSLQKGSPPVKLCEPENFSDYGM